MQGRQGIKGIQNLRRDHELILVALDALAALAGRVVAGQVEVARIEELLVFFREFADAYHHAKEEQVLFPALEAAGFPRAAGPVGVMLYEHDQGRDLLRRLEESLRGLPESGDALVDAAGAYHSLLGHHIHKEDQILFALAEAHLDAGDPALAAGFELVETARMSAEVREQFEHLVADAAAAGRSAPATAQRDLQG